MDDLRADVRLQRRGTDRAPGVVRGLTRSRLAGAAGVTADGLSVAWADALRHSAPKRALLICMSRVSAVCSAIAPSDRNGKIVYFY
jgi:hypothetical protein